MRETKDASSTGRFFFLSHLVEPRKGCDTVHQPMATQIDEHCVLASVQKMNLQRYQLGEPPTVQGLSYTGVLRDKGGGRHR